MIARCAQLRRRHRLYASPNVWRARGCIRRDLCVWEFYHKAGKCFLSKAIDVDERFQGQGIGPGLLDAVMLHHKGKIQLSGKYTEAGASLIKQYAVGWMPPPLDNWIRSRRHKRRQCGISYFAGGDLGISVGRRWSSGLVSAQSFRRRTRCFFTTLRAAASPRNF